MPQVCKWCGGSRDLLENALVWWCDHCDVGHNQKACPICPALHAAPSG